MAARWAVRCLPGSCGRLGLFFWYQGFTWQAANPCYGAHFLWHACFLSVCPVVGRSSGWDRNMERLHPPVNLPASRSMSSGRMPCSIRRNSTDAGAPDHSDRSKNETQSDAVSLLTSVPLIIMITLPTKTFMAAGDVFFNWLVRCIFPLKAQSHISVFILSPARGGIRKGWLSPFLIPPWRIDVMSVSNSNSHHQEFSRSFVCRYRSASTKSWKSVYRFTNNFLQFVSFCIYSYL